MNTFQVFILFNSNNSNASPNEQFNSNPNSTIQTLTPITCLVFLNAKGCKGQGLTYKFPVFLNERRYPHHALGVCVCVDFFFFSQSIPIRSSLLLATCKVIQGYIDLQSCAALDLGCWGLGSRI